MRLTFGMHLDHGVWPHPLHGRDALAGETTVGPDRLLAILETHLGLSRPPVLDSLRISDYRMALSELDSPQAWFHRSFQRDPWGTAAELLSWRDELVEAGWDGRPVSATRRLEVLTSLTAPKLPGLADRMWAALRALPPDSRFVEHVRLVDPADSLPSVWRELWSRWQVPLVSAVPDLRAEPNGTDLGKLQSGVVGPTGDGTVLHLQGASPDDSAEMLAAWLAAHWDSLGTTVVVCESHEDILDAALRRYHLPCFGSHRGSSWRPATQVLPLVLSLGWKPLDPNRLLEFLTLPRSPLPWGRMDLAHALQQAPGWDGPAWREGWERALARSAHASNGDVDAERERIEQRLRKWLGGIVPLAQFAREEGMPVAMVCDTASQVLQWTRSMLAQPSYRDDAILHTARTQALALREILANWHESLIPASHLEQVLAQVSVVATETTVFPGEQGRLSVVRSPGAVLAPADSVIWWTFVNPEPPALPAPWTAAERACLRTMRIEPPTLAERLWRVASTWRRPILAARRQLVLVSWRGRGPTPVQPHPLFDELKATFCPDPLSESRIHRDPDSLLRMLPTSQLPPKAEVHPWPHWTIAAGRIQARETESSSSLEMLIECPLRWTLKYQAGLHSRAMTGLPDGSQLYGHIAHHVLETVLMCSPLPRGETARSMARVEFDAVLPKLGAALLLPTRATERLVLRDTIELAAAALVEHLHHSAYRVQGVEVQRHGVLAGLQLEGILDVLLQDVETLLPAVLDLKWSSTRYRKKLVSGSAVQLALYGHLAQEGSSSLPPVAYFSVRDARMLTVPGTRFARAVATSGPPVAETLSAVVRAHADRLGDLQQGRVHAAGHGELKEDHLENGLLTMRAPCQFCEYRHMCGAP